LKQQVSLGEAKNSSLCEIILYAIARTVNVSEQRPTLAGQVQGFTDVFAERSDALGCVPVSLITALIAPEGSFSATSATQNESLHVAVVTALKHLTSVNENVQAAVRNDEGAFGALKTLQTSRNSNLAKVATDVYEIVVPKVTPVDELD